MKHFFPNLIILLTLFTLTGCQEPTPVGNSIDGYQKIENTKIQPEEAVKLAAPYLDQTFELRIKDSDLKRNAKMEPAIWVTLKKDYYYVVKESYPSPLVYFYLDHAAKVHRNNGEVIKPE